MEASYIFEIVFINLIVCTRYESNNETCLAIAFYALDNCIKYYHSAHQYPSSGGRSPGRQQRNKQPLELFGTESAEHMVQSANNNQQRQCGNTQTGMVNQPPEN